MDGEIPTAEIAALVDEEHGKPRPPGKPKAPTWVSALKAPETFDPLEVVATDIFYGLCVAYQRTLFAVGLKEDKRAKLLAQLAAQINATIPRRRLWEAEQVIKNEAAGMLKGTSGAKMESRDAGVGSTASEHGATSRTSPRRGRPRSR